MITVPQHSCAVTGCQLYCEKLTNSKKEIKRNATNKNILMLWADTSYLYMLSFLLYHF